MPGLNPFYRGDTCVIRFSFSDGDGTALDISNHHLWITLKVRLEDADTDAAFQKEIIFPGDANAAQGIGVLTLESNETSGITPGEYFYDFQYVIPGVPPQVTTLLSGRVRVLPDVTLSDGS